MKNKIVMSLFAMFLLFSLGATFAVIYTTNTTQEIKHIIELHQVEELRRTLIIDIQEVQANLYTFDTPYARDLDSIIANVNAMEESAEKCTSCHHHPRLSGRIQNVQLLIEDFARSLSYFMTTSANSKRVEALKEETVAIGNKIIASAEQMSHSATDNLQEKTEMAMDDIFHVKEILLITVLVTFLFF